jgi:ubiquinone/menaquinone biosynthesis C-methylase UbiE
MSQKIIFLNDEGDNWYLRNKDKSQGYVDLDLISKYLNPYEIKSHLEIGCASGYKTFELAHRLNSKGFGIDPSTMAILEANKIKETFKDYRNNVTFKVGTSDDLSDFENDFFELVFVGFCLYLVDRDLLESTYNEIDRVLKKNKFVAILDFDPGTEYSNIYAHNQEVKSFKSDYAKYFISKGYYLIAKENLIPPNIGFSLDPDLRISIQLLQKV